MNFVMNIILKDLEKQKKKQHVFVKKDMEEKKCENIISTEIEVDNKENYYIKEIIKKKQMG